MPSTRTAGGNLVVAIVQAPSSPRSRITSRCDICTCWMKLSMVERLYILPASVWTSAAPLPLYGSQLFTQVQNKPARHAPCSFGTAAGRLRRAHEIFLGRDVSDCGLWKTVLERVKECPTCQRPTWNGISTGSRKDLGGAREAHRMPHAWYWYSLS